MIPQPAQYLIRIDDLCPTVARSRWERLHELITEFGIRPILAVIPDNQDSDLMNSEADPRFWGQMRRLEAAGATIALHGYQHLCESLGRSLLPLHRHTEFAGVEESVQREWIRKGIEILHNQGLSPRLWVAPRHGFDLATLRSLRAERILYLSDGFTREPVLRGGVTWIPQQLWGPVHKSKGLWTICIHSSSASRGMVRKLGSFLRAYGKQFTSFERVKAEYTPRSPGLADMLYEVLALGRMKASRFAKKRLR
jgi:predicted deacetylase